MGREEKGWGGRENDVDNGYWYAVYISIIGGGVVHRKGCERKERYHYK